METHEPEVLQGGLEAIEQHRPYIICELLRSVDFEKLLSALTPIVNNHYHLYKMNGGFRGQRLPLSAIVDMSNSKRDWLIAPKALDDSFYRPFRHWFRQVRACGPETNILVD